MSRSSRVLPALAVALILPLTLFTMPASGQQKAMRQLPHATCLAMAAAGIERDEAELWVRPPSGKPLPPQGGLSRSAAILDSIFDGRAPSSAGRKPCVPKTLTPDEVRRLKAVIPQLAKPRHANRPKVRARLDRVKREAECWNKKAIEHPREVKKAREDKEQATGFIGQLGKVRGELGEMQSALK